MSSAPKRAYRSNLRAAQTEATRQAILDAAEKLAMQRGWQGATMPAIAAEAGVAKETLYASFGSKPVLIAEMVRARVGLADPQAQEKLSQIGAEQNLSRQVKLWAGWLTEILVRVAPLMAMLRSGAEVEPEIAALYARLHAGRRANLSKVAEHLCKHILQGAPTGETVTDLLWHLASPELFTLSTTLGGQSPEEFALRLSEQLTAILVPS